MYSIKPIKLSLSSNNPKSKYSFFLYFKFGKEYIYNMKYLHKFNEGNDKKISNDRINQIIKDMDNLTQVINDNLSNVKNITQELSSYTSKSSKTNNQIDDAYINFGALNSKLADIITTINSINTKLKDYTENGTSEIY